MPYKSKQEVFDFICMLKNQYIWECICLKN